MKKETLYKQQIIDHYKYPHNHGVLDDCTHKAEETNSSCGDEVKVTLKVENGVVNDVKFEARGCAISIAAASMLSDQIKGLKVEELHDLEKLSLKLINMDESSGRIKCGTLAAKAVEKAIRPRAV
ncbi:MAG: SUF system NifU family Fe-S cluster assembly protein [Candidatus Dojkabacteria bacterium]|nr:MAG: SUF system NifU family Fe-S cluster assembly protein [Candidatus Dojkabacteria bacterium]